jgi:alpha-beta hydrolase superfamily lysophospholipase
LNGADRGHAAHGLRLINDTRSLTQLIQHENQLAGLPELPVTLLGLSWGAKIAAATTALFPDEIKRLVLLYPGLESRIRPNAWQRFRLNLARRFEVTKRHIPIPLSDPALFTSDPEWQRFIASDPLALHTVTSSLLNAGRDLDTLVNAHAARIACPILLMLAGQDAIIDNHKVMARVASFASSSVMTHRYPSTRHTLEFEPIREQFVSDLLNWLG